MIHLLLAATFVVQTNPSMLALEIAAQRVAHGHQVSDAIFAGTVTEPDGTGEVTITTASLTDQQRLTLLDIAGDNQLLVQAADLLCGAQGSTTPRKRWRGSVGRFAAARCVDAGVGYAFVVILGPVRETEGTEP